MPDKFPTQFYESHHIPTAPNGDKLRSDDAGLFFWIEGERVPYPIPAGYVPPSQRTAPEPAPEPESEPAPEPKPKRGKAAAPAVTDEKEAGA